MTLFHEDIFGNMYIEVVIYWKSRHGFPRLQSYPGHKVIEFRTKWTMTGEIIDGNVKHYVHPRMKRYLTQKLKYANVDTSWLEKHW